jgi:hypothetical protein
MPSKKSAKSSILPVKGHQDLIAGLATFQEEKREHPNSRQRKDTLRSDAISPWTIPILKGSDPKK